MNSSGPMKLPNLIALPIHVLVAGLIATLAALWGGEVTFQRETAQCSPALGSNWCVTTEPASNAYYLWRSDPALALIQDLISSHCAHLVYACLALYFGLLALSTAQGQRELSPHKVAISALWSLTTTLLLSFDEVSLAAVQWIPLLCTALLGGSAALKQGQRRLKTFTLGFFLSALCALSANQIAPLSTLLSILLAYALTRQRSSSELSQDPVPTKGAPLNAALCVLMLAIPLLQLVFIPSPPTPWYPQGVQVVPDDEIPGMLRPFVGPLPAVPIINRLAVKELYPHVFLIALIACLASIFLIARKNRSWVTSCSLILIPLACLFLDLRVPEEVSIISPLLTIPRLIPHLFFFPLEVFGFGLCLLGCALALNRSSLGASLLVCLLCLGAWKVLPPPASPSSADDPAAWASPEEYQRHRAIMDSPSQFVLRALHWDVLGPNRDWIVERQQLIASASFRRLKSDEVSVSASQRSEDLPKLFDSKGASRWTSGQGKQTGSEWILLRFKDSQALDGIELFLGDFVTDFPRGLRVSSLRDCADLLPPAPTERLQVINLPRWYGGIDFTPAGYPYFKGRYSMRIYFPQTLTTRCLMFEQIGQSDSSDWSIAELRVLEATSPSEAKLP